jgi:superfamily II DNA or RNA helicase
MAKQLQLTATIVSEENADTQKRQKHDLRPYQQKAVQAVRASMDGNRSVLLILPTGTGKTIVFSEIIRLTQSRANRTLVLAHRDELLDQAIEKIAIQTGRRPSKEKASDFASRTASTVVASVQSLQGTRLLSWPADHFQLLIIDEAHHAVAKTYSKIIDHFSAAYLLGVTATPDRADQKSLGKRFGAIAYEYPLKRAIDEGYLVRIVGRRIRDFDIDLRGLRVVAGDYSDAELSGRLENHILPICSSIREETTGLKTLIFLPTVEACRLFSETLKAQGVKADYVHGGMNSGTRRRTLYDFSIGAIDHLCSCSLLLEGYDEPTIQAIVILRPTTSRALYSQLVGRGTRLSPGKDCLRLIEFTYNSDRLSLVTPYELFATEGFGERVRRIAGNNENVSEDTDYLDALTQAHEQHYSVEGILDRLLTKKTRGKSYEFTTFDPFGLSDLLEVDLSGEFDISYEGHKLVGPITEKQAEILSRYGVAHLEMITKAQASVLIDKLFASPWRPLEGPATSKQLYRLRKYGYNLKGITKAQASMLIDRLEEQRRQNVQF